MRRGSSVVVCLTLAAGMLLAVSAAQAQVGGTIQGYITDQSDARLPGVTVVVTHTESGFERTVVTDSKGFYRGKALQPGTYTITASLENMQTVRQENIFLLVGQIIDVDLEMGVAAAEEIITVTAESPLIELSRSTAATYLTEKEIEELPIVGRDFTAFAEFAPTVQPETDRGFIHISGQKGIYTGMNIDGTSGKSAFFGYGRGGEATENEGIVIAQDSVKEFQVVTSGFAPEYGNNAGGYLNVVTKSGTNTLRGTAFYFFRDDGLAEDLPSSPLDDARGIDGSRPVDEFERTNWGLSVGGPISKDRTHFFFSYDQTERDEPFRRDLNIPGLFDAVIARGGEFPALVRGYDRNADGTATGLFLESIENLILFGKVDHRFNDSHTGTFRINYTDYEVTNSQPGAESLKTEDTISFVAQLVSLIGTNKVNEARIQLSEDNLDRLNDFEGGPPTIAAELEFRIGGRRDFLGKFFFLPIFVTEEKTQIQDNFSYLFGNHDLKFGVDYQKDDLSQLFAGFKDGRFRFNSIDDFLNDRAFFELIFYGPITNPNFDESQEILAVYAQDTWRANENLTINYGVRYSETDNPGGLQHVFPAGREIPDDDHIAPRFGFTYTPGATGKDVIRGGAGVFYGRTPTLLFAGPVVQNGIFPNFGISFLLFFFSAFQPYGQPIDNLNPDPDTPNEPNLVDPNFQDAETLRLNLGYEREFKPHWSAAIDLVYAEGNDLQTNIDTNLFPPTFDSFGRPMYSSDRPNDAFGEIFTRASVGESEYTAITLSLNRRFSDRYSFHAHYTYSEDEDTDSDERSATGVGVSDFTNIGYDFGPSLRDVENRLVVTGMVELPLGFRISGVVEFRDGNPWTATDNELLVDDYCPHDNCPDIFGVINGQLSRRHAFTNESFERVDLRVTKAFEFGDWDVDLFAEVFNLLDEDTHFVDDDERQVTTSDGVTGNPEFGIPDDLISTPRQFQLGVRISFN